MTDEREPPNTMEPLGPAYEVLQQRLLADGALWRTGLPSTRRLEQRLHALHRQEQAAQFRAAGEQRIGRFRLLSQIAGGYMVFQKRMRAALAMTAIAVVVVLFVVLFHSFAGGHTAQPGNPANTTATAVSGPTGQFNPVAGLAHQPAQPLIAPTNPQVVYELRDDAAGQLVLARTDDAGKNWRNFFLPAGKASDQFPPTLFLSPLDAQTVFLTVGGTRSGNSCVVSHALESYAALSGGENICALQYLSKDGGAHWSQVQFPASGIVGDTGILNEALGPILGNTILRPQGTRLYAVFGPYSQYNQLEGSAGGRLVESLDGGNSWQFTDHGLTGDIICDIAPAPSGSTVFALTSDITCSAGGGETMTLWRSLDAGAHWSRVGTLPGNTDQGMVAVSAGNGGQPLLYINMPTHQGGAYRASLRPQAGGGGGSSSPADLQVSADGGKTWRPAPTQGFPDVTANPGPLLGVLSDGSLLFAASSGPGQHPTLALYSWKSGDASWRKVTPTLSNAVQSVLVTAAGSGQQTIWVITAQGKNPNFTYSVQSYRV